MSGPDLGLAPAAVIALVLVALSGCLGDAAGPDVGGSEPRAPASPPIPRPGMATGAAHQNGAGLPTTLHWTDCLMVRGGLTVPGHLAPRDAPRQWGGERALVTSLDHWLLSCARLGIGQREFMAPQLLVEVDNNFVAPQNCTEGQPWLVRRIVAHSPDLAASLGTLATWNVVPGAIAIREEAHGVLTVVQATVATDGGAAFKLNVTYSNHATRTQPTDIDMIWVDDDGVVQILGAGERDIAAADPPMAVAEYSEWDAMGDFTTDPVPALAEVARNFTADMAITYFEDHACRIPR